MAEGKPMRKKNHFYKSPGVLGKMYRALKQEINIDEIIKIEYDLKIIKKYKLGKDMLNDFKIFKHLAAIYVKVVKPLTDEIKNLMIEKKIISESDLYTSGCELSKLASTRDEEFSIRTDIRMIIKQLKEKYQEILQKYQLDFIKRSKLKVYN